MGVINTRQEKKSEKTVQNVATLNYISLGVKLTNEAEQFVWIFVYDNVVLEKGETVLAVSSSGRPNTFLWPLRTLHISGVHIYILLKDLYSWNDTK